MISLLVVGPVFARGLWVSGYFTPGSHLAGEESMEGQLEDKWEYSENLVPFGGMPIHRS
jgi:hypothetical protein